MSRVLRAGGRPAVLALSCALATLLILTSATAGTGAAADTRPAVFAGGVIRIAGADRYGTSGAVSRTGWPAAPCVVIATGVDFPDALAAAPLAEACGGPLLMTLPHVLPATVSAEIGRLGAKEAVIIGGTGAIDAHVASAVAALVGGVAHVKRLAGVNRYDTARLVAAELGARVPLGGRVVVATGESYADALSAAPFAAYLHYPILLTRKITIPPETAAALGSIGATSTLVVGGTGAVSAAVEALLPGSERIAGANRYDTARRMADYAADHGCSFNTVTIAAGTGFADALSGGPLAARNHGPVLLTAATALSAEARACLEAHADAIARVYILGGNGAVADGVSAALTALTNGSSPPVWSEERRVSQALDAGDIREFDADSGRDGAIHLVWKEKWSLLYRRLDRFGNTTVATLRLPAGTPDVSTYCYPAVADVPSGGAVVVFRVPGGLQPSLYALKLDESGRLVVGPKRIYSGYTRFTDVGADDKGRVHVVSRDDNDRVLYGVFDASTLSAKLAMTPIASALSNELDEDPVLKVWPGGSADVVWFDHRGFVGYPIPFQLYRSRFVWNTGGGPYPVGPMAVDQKRLTAKPGGYFVGYSESNSPSNNRYPALAFEPSGLSQMAWMDSNERVYWTRMTATGDASVAERMIQGVGAAGALSAHRVRLVLRSDLSADIVAGRSFPASSGFAGTRLALTRLRSDGTTRVAGSRIVQETAQPGDFWFGRAQGLDHLQLAYASAPGFGKDRIYYLDTARNPEANDRTRCDLVIDDAHGVDGGPYREGQTAQITVQVTNAGYVASPPSVVRFSKGATVVADVAVPALAVDATRSVTATWLVPANNAEPNPVFTVEVDPAHVIAETSEANDRIAHRVPCWLRPTGKDVILWPLDETRDEGHTLKGWDVDHYHAALSGTASETLLPFSSSVDVSGSVWPQQAFHNVPPGVYTLTYSASGLAPASPSLTVTVTRDPGNPYAITYTPSMPVELWFNSWGDISGTVRHGGSPINGASVALVGTGRSAVATTGAFVFRKLPAGAYELRVTADGYAPVRSQAVTVSVGATATAAVQMTPTSVAYYDVRVVDSDGGAIAGATVRIHDAAHNVLSSGTSDADGVAYLTGTAGVNSHVNVSAPWFVTKETTATVAPVAGRLYPITVALALDTSLVSRTSCDWAKWCITADFYSIGGNDWYGFYRCFATRFGVDWVDDRGTRKIQAFDADAKGYPFMISLLTVPVDWEIVEGGPFGFGSYPVPWESSQRSNVKVEAVKLIDATDGSTLWPASPQSPWYSHAGAGDELRTTYTMPVGGVAVPDWSRLEVRMWVNVQQVGGPTPPYWDTSPLGDSDGKAVIIYRPADGSHRIVPWLADPW